MSETSEPSGHPAVDAVLDALAKLEDLPVGEHPPIFEEAHEALRAALAQARDGARVGGSVASGSGGAGPAS